jgi:hypothetical protein
MIDTDKYKETNWDLRGQFTHTEMADEVLLLLAEVRRLRKGIQNLCNTGSETSYDWVCMAIKTLTEMIK